MGASHKSVGPTKERLFATVYTTDDEAAKIWRECTDIDPTHILKFESDNFGRWGIQDHVAHAQKFITTTEIPLPKKKQ